LYRWPQFSAPAFKIVESRWLKRNSVGGDLSLLRFKVPWPLAVREILLSEYELEYFEENLIVVMYSSVCFMSCYMFCCLPMAIMFTANASVAMSDWISCRLHSVKKLMLDMLLEVVFAALYW
jgi:hypothetical protein